VKKILCYILTFLFGLIFTIRLNAQSVTASIDKDTILIGEKIKLTLSANNITSNKFSIFKWFQFPDTINHFEVIKRSKIDTSSINGEYNYRQIITITSFDSGSWEIPALKISFRNNHSNKLASKQTLPLIVQVLPADISNVKDYHDVKDIIQVLSPVSSSNNKFIPVISLVLVLFIVIIWLIMERRKTSKPIEGKSIPDPYGWAIKQLTLLEKQQLSIREYYDQLYHICRQYFFLEFSKPVLYSTTSEWVSSLQTMPIEQNLKTAFSNFLIKIDSIRFANEILTDKKNIKEMIVLARTMINTFNKIKPVHSI
jgi:hypothetical protein